MKIFIHLANMVDSKQ